MRLGKLIALYLRVEGLALRDIASEIRVSTATMSRIQNGKTCDMRSLAKLISWLITDDNNTAAGRK